jgi:hypothetical protein
MHYIEERFRILGKVYWLREWPIEKINGFKRKRIESTLKTNQWTSRRQW